MLLLACAAYVVAHPAATTSIAPQVKMPSLGVALERAVAPGQATALGVAERRVAAAPAAISPSGWKVVVQRPPEPAPGHSSRPVALTPAVTPPPPASRPSLAVRPKPLPIPPGVPVPPPAPAPVPVPPPPPTPAAAEPLLDASFESGLQGWNTAGVGEVLPQLTTDIVRDGERAVAVRLSGELDRSELILGGNGGGSTAGTLRFREGDEYYYAFSFYIESMVYGEPGAHNLIMQFKSDGEGSPNFGLQLWDYAGDGGSGGGRGLWSHGGAMGGDRFLAPVPEQVWHDVVIHFRASSVDAGFYEVYLDDRLLDSRSGVSMIVPGRSYAYIKDGLYRNGSEIPGTSEIRLDAVRLGETLQSVQP